MLTLQELKQVVSNREERRKVPSAKYLRENEVAVAKPKVDGLCGNYLHIRPDMFSIVWGTMQQFFRYLPVEIMCMKQKEK